MQQRIYRTLSRNANELKKLKKRLEQNIINIAINE